jgi:DNA-directed RNA polymerase II subunit RPB1
VAPPIDSPEASYGSTLYGDPGPQAEAAPLPPPPVPPAYVPTEPVFTPTEPVWAPTQPAAHDPIAPVVPLAPAPLPTPLPPTTTPLAAPGLPQRRPTVPAAVGEADNIERIGSPSRPPEEIRSILSRYRSGLQTGRAETDASSEPTTPEQE